MPVPRRFDRSLPERDSTRINERIRVPEVRLIGPDGQQVGILKTAEALRYAQERDLDLVEVAADAKPPVCRVLDYSKYKYEQAQRQKAARKHQQQITIREIKFRPKIAQHDYDTKKGHVERFLKARDKVKVTIMFRGREVAHPERGEIILNRLADELQDLAVIEQRPTQDGRNMTMMLGPLRARDPEDAGQPSGGGGSGKRRSRDGGGKDRATAPAPATEPAAEEAKVQASAAEEAKVQASAAEEAKVQASAAEEANAPPAAPAPAAQEAPAAARASATEEGEPAADEQPATPPEAAPAAKPARPKATAKAK